MGKGRDSNFIYIIKRNIIMIIKLPKEVRDAINTMPFNKTVKTNAIKIYAALYMKSHLKNSNGYFPVSSEYLQSINKRYNNILKYFIEKNLIDFYKKAYQDENDIFNTIYRKSYNKELGICSKYKFLVNIEVGDDINVDMVTNKYNRWYEIIENSLIESGLEIKITRDSFGRRVHHSGIRNYKKDFKGFYTIDSISSQPRLLYLHLKEKGIVDKEFNDIFENKKDFYLETANKLDFDGSKEDKRNEAKDLFMFWINGNGYVPNFKIHNIYPVVSSFLKQQKKGNYKNAGSMLQRLESKIWIDDILNAIPCDFALPVHDSVIVKEKDVDKVLMYCQNKYAELELKKEII
jgi:hypothetical protein